MTYDVIVVGGGPAGATCARHAARLGLDVLLIEKRVHPRRKACGGGITLRVVDVLDFSIGSVIEREQCGLRLHAPSGIEVVEKRSTPTGYTIRREDFDNLLLRQAESADAEVIEGVRVVDVIEGSDAVEVITDDRNYRGQVLVGADGVNSTVARKTGIKTRWEDDEVCLCIEASVPMGPEDIVRLFGDPEEHGNRILIEIYFGALVHGYAWAFAKRAEVSLGIGALVSELHDLRGAWKKFVGVIEERGGVKCDLSSETAARVPLAGPIKRMYSSHTLLAGDAAGFVSPATGEGIYYAIESGRIAAETANDIVSGIRGVDTRTYQERCDKALGKDLRVAKSLADMMFHSIENMERVCQMAYDDEVMRHYTMELVMGLRSYRESRNRVIRRMLRKHLRTALRMVF